MMKHFDGRVKVEELTQSLVDIYPKDVKIYKNEYSAVEDEKNKEQIKQANKWVWCGTFSFIYVDKENDNEFTNNKMMEHLTKKVKKDYSTVIELEDKEQRGEELSAKEQKKKKTSYSGMRSGIAVKKILELIPDNSVHVIATRNPTTKISVANTKIPNNKFDIGSGVLSEIFSKDNEAILQKLLNACMACGDDQFCLITSGLYETRCKASEDIKILMTKKLTLTQEQIDKVLYHIQPIRPEAEKTCILTQRKYLMNENVGCAQGGNSDGLIFVGGKFLADIKVSDQDHQYIKKQVEDW